MACMDNHTSTTYRGYNTGIQDVTIRLVHVNDEDIQTSSRDGTVAKRGRKRGSNVDDSFSG